MSKVSNIYYTKKKKEYGGGPSELLKTDVLEDIQYYYLIHCYLIQVMSSVDIIDVTEQISNILKLQINLFCYF